jgi:hypothetical protein
MAILPYPSNVPKPGGGAPPKKVCWNLPQEMQPADSQDNKPAGGVAAPAGGKAPAGVPVWSSFMPPGGPVMGLPMGQANRPLPQPQYAGNQLNMMMGAVPPPPPANASQPSIGESKADWQTRPLPDV